MARLSNFFVGFLNFFSLLGGLIAIAFSLYIYFHGGTACQNNLFRLFKPLMAIGLLISLVSLLGLLGSCCKNNFLLYLYLIVTPLMIVGFAVFAGFVFAVTNNVPGQALSGIGCGEYRLGNYSSWLRNHFVNEKNWKGIRSCLVDAQVCKSLAHQTPTAADFYKRSLSPLQSGCCKPPIDCGFKYKNATFWTEPKSGIRVENSDCLEWSNNPDKLCYNCNSCKAGVLNPIKKQGRNLSILLACLVVLFIIIYSIGCCAARNTRADRCLDACRFKHNP